MLRDEEKPIEAPGATGKDAAGIGNHDDYNAKEAEHASSTEAADLGRLVTFGEGDKTNPLNMPESRKWAFLLVTATCSLCVTCTSSVVTTAYTGLERDFGISHEVAILGLSLFVAGLGTGPLLLAPFSEFYGRRPVYIVSFSAFWLLGFPVAFSNNAAVFFIFRFLTGFSGSAFLRCA